MAVNNNTSNTELIPNNVGVSAFGLPYIVIVIIGLIFWPAGILLLIIKINSDRKASMLASGLVTLLGWGLLLLGSLILLSFLIAGGKLPSGMDIAILVFALLMTTGAIALLFTGSRLKKKAMNYRRYIAIIWNNGVTDLNKICHIVSKPYAQVRRDLEIMIAKKFLPNGYIDDGEDKIVLPGLEEVGIETGFDIVSCKNCGANKKMRLGTVAQCDFCGSKLMGG